MSTQKRDRSRNAVCVGKLVALEATRTQMAVLTARRELLVQEARALGATWGEIAAMLGVSRQAVAQLYGPRALV